jgi:hypothetical protein
MVIGKCPFFLFQWPAPYLSWLEALHKIRIHVSWAFAPDDFDRTILHYGYCKKIGIALKIQLTVPCKLQLYEDSSPPPPPGHLQEKLLKANIYKLFCHWSRTFFFAGMWRIYMRNLFYTLQLWSETMESFEDNLSWHFWQYFLNMSNNIYY